MIILCCSDKNLATWEPCFLKDFLMFVQNNKLIESSNPIPCVKLLESIMVLLDYI